MDQFFLVDVPDRRLWFDIMYLLAFLLAFCLLLYLGKKRGYPTLSWLLMLAAGWLLFVIGCKLPTYSIAEWTYALNAFRLPSTTEMAVLGGLLLGSLGLLAGRWWSNLPLKSLDLFAVVLPLCMAVQRIGCFIIGCCYGSPSALPWAVHYPAGTLPHAHQFEAGLIGPENLVSLAVHPYQLYELLIALLVVTLVLLSRRYWKVPGSLFFSSMLYYGVLRFLIEFFRAGSALATTEKLLWGLNEVQTGLILMLPLLWVFLLWREQNKSQFEKVAPTPVESPLGWNLLFILLMVTVFWALRNWLVLREILVLNIVFLPLLAAAAVKIFQSFTVPAYRWLTASVLILSLFLMSQTLPNSQPDSAYLKTYRTISLGGGGGKYENYLNIGQGEGCDRIANVEYFEQKYTVVGGSYAVTREKEKETLTYGLNVYGGQHTEKTLSTGYDKVTTLFGLNPFIRYDRRFVGIGAGLHLGNLVYTLEDKLEDGSGIPESGSVKMPFYPQLYLQAGPRDIIFARFQLADHFPSAMPGLRYKVGLGTGFGLKNGTALMVGTNTMNPYVSAYIPLHESFVIESLYLWGMSSTPNAVDQRQFSLGLHYRFDHEESGKKVGKKKKKKNP